MTLLQRKIKWDIKRGKGGIETGEEGEGERRWGMEQKGERERRKAGKEGEEKGQ